MLGRKCFLNETEEENEENLNMKWIYFCNCDPIHSDFVESLAIDANIVEDSISGTILEKLCKENFHDFIVYYLYSFLPFMTVHNL